MEEQKPHSTQELVEIIDHDLRKGGWVEQDGERWRVNEAGLVALQSLVEQHDALRRAIEDMGDHVVALERIGKREMPDEQKGHSRAREAAREISSVADPDYAALNTSTEDVMAMAFALTDLFEQFEAHEATLRQIEALKPDRMTREDFAEALGIARNLAWRALNPASEPEEGA